MANPTTNFGWQMPTSTDLVTDLPADFEVFGQAVDTTLVDLKGGTTGQVLSKASNTDMDFTWVAQDDSNAIQNAIVDAKGDLIAASAADTPARLAVGTNGQVLTADSTASTGLAWATMASGAYTQLATGSLSGATTTISSISSSYKKLILVLNNVSITGSDEITMQLNSLTTGYTWVNFRAGASAGDMSISGAQIKIPTGNTLNTDTNYRAVIEFDNYATSGPLFCRYYGVFYCNAANTGLQSFMGTGSNQSAAVLSSITLKANWGGAYTFDNGTYTLFGVN